MKIAGQVLLGMLLTGAVLSFAGTGQLGRPVMDAARFISRGFSL